MIDPVDRDGETPLMLAAQFNSHSAFLALVRAGADVFTRNVRGKTALNMVQEDGNDGCGDVESSNSRERQINQLIRRVEHILMARFNKGLNNSTRRYSVT